MSTTSRRSRTWAVPPMHMCCALLEARNNFGLSLGIWALPELDRAYDELQHWQDDIRALRQGHGR